jgi:hypothetical protein
MTRVDGHAPNAAPTANGAGPSPRVFDLGKAADAARAEAEGRTEITVVAHGEQFTVPAMDQWDVDVLTEMTNGNFAHALGMILGAAEYRRLRTAMGGTLTMGAARLLLDHVADASGMGSVGEQLASGTSSAAITRR